jgi:trehalose-6-phosphatase
MVEVRYRAGGKSTFAEEIFRWLLTNMEKNHTGPVDFVLCVGDDRSDEDMFTTIQVPKATMQLRCCNLQACTWMCAAPSNAHT